MKSVKINFDQVDYPIDAKTINTLGKENGISMYIIRILRSFVKTVINEDGKPENVDCTSITTNTLKIDKGANCWIGQIDGNFYYDYKNSKIIEICKIEFE